MTQQETLLAIARLAAAQYDRTPDGVWLGEMRHTVLGLATGNSPGSDMRDKAWAALAETTEKGFAAAVRTLLA